MIHTLCNLFEFLTKFWTKFLCNFVSVLTITSIRTRGYVNFDQLSKWTLNNYNRHNGLIEVVQREFVDLFQHLLKNDENSTELKIEIEIRKRQKIAQKGFPLGGVPGLLNALNYFYAGQNHHKRVGLRPSKGKMK